MIDSFVKRVEQCYEQGLPGYLDSPMLVQTRSLDPPKDSNPKQSAVGIILHPRNNDIIIRLIERTSDGSVHSGQVSFPGGRMEAEESPRETALREVEEEIGLKANALQVIGEQTPIYIPPSNFMVYPFLMVQHSVQSLTAQISEVKNMLEVPLSALNHHNTIQTVEIAIRDDRKLKVKAYVVDDLIIWGATAIMLSETLTILKRIDEGN